MESEKVIKKYEEELKKHLTSSQIKKLASRLERVCFKIAPLNPETGNTHTIDRWELPKSTPYYASKNECEKMCQLIIEDVLGFFGEKKYKPRKYLTYLANKQITKESIVNSLKINSRIGSLELPVEYDNYKKGHSSNNLFWLSPFTEIEHLRSWVGNSNIVTKIQVKAYLTDRRQTGSYQTNREIRWETNIKSPQFATRTDCIKIEAKLLAQIATFTGAPEIPNKLIPIFEKALTKPFKKDSFNCPISGKEILYEEFFERASNPVHGRSGYQVGHLNPIAGTGKHEANNTSWITDLGNRVQGESSLDEITEEIFYMAAFHRKRLNINWDKVQKIADKTPKTDD